MSHNANTPVENPNNMGDIIRNIMLNSDSVFPGIFIGKEPEDKTETLTLYNYIGGRKEQDSGVGEYQVQARARGNTYPVGKEWLDAINLLIINYNSKQIISTTIGLPEEMRFKDGVEGMFYWTMNFTIFGDDGRS